MHGNATWTNSKSLIALAGILQIQSGQRYVVEVSALLLFLLLGVGLVCSLRKLLFFLRAIHGALLAAFGVKGRPQARNSFLDTFHLLGQVSHLPVERSHVSGQVLRVLVLHTGGAFFGCCSLGSARLFGVGVWLASGSVIWARCFDGSRGNRRSLPTRRHFLDPGIAFRSDPRQGLDHVSHLLLCRWLISTADLIRLLILCLEPSLCCSSQLPQHWIINFQRVTLAKPCRSRTFCRRSGSLLLVLRLWEWRDRLLPIR